MVTDILGQKSDKKNPVYETVVWQLTLKKPGLGNQGIALPDRVKILKNMPKIFKVFLEILKIFEIL